MDFERDIAIDETNLTEELINQPQRYYDWGEAAAIAHIDVLIAKDKLEITKAEVELKIRKYPQLHDLPEKPTESMVRSAVLINRKVKRSNKNYLDALRVERTLSKAERAFEHRKKSLEGLVYKRNQLYFADPKTDSHTQVNTDRKRLLNRARENRKIRRR